MRRVLLFVASGAYTGYIPVASGTWGTLVAFPLFWFCFDPLRHFSTFLYIACFIAAVGLACWVAGRAEALLQEHDSHAITIDEIVGYLAATLFMAPTWENTLVAFLVFRVFDVVKPWPAGAIDRGTPGGTGVVLDDVVSGLYANLATRALLGIVG
jgi:phosphatidylglycerophosphatase A